MTLQQAIESIPDWGTMQPSELLTALQAVIVTTKDSQLYTYAGIIIKLGEEAGLGFRATLKFLTQPSNPLELTTNQFEGLDFAHSRLEGPGIDLSLESVQATLDSLIGIPQLAPLVPVIKAIGVQVTHPWANTTLAEVEAAVNELLVLQQQQLAQAKRIAQATALLHGIEQLRAGQTFTNSELLTLVESNLPSE